MGVFNAEFMRDTYNFTPKVKIHFLTFNNSNEPEFKVKGKSITLQAKEVGDGVMTLDFQQLLTSLFTEPKHRNLWKMGNEGILGEGTVNWEYGGMKVEWFMGYGGNMEGF